ncbi:MAG: FtsW/RodA/SpoVE family cell cycle protein, partial [Planctomycetota bacterium]|nr:FtsW/RodA/SpoVE family cell cycle protein [Planctomycetota bacterium]
FGLQTVFNLFVVTGLGPTKGIALPLLSSGGTGWILTAASLGVLVGMDRSRQSEEAGLMEAKGGAPASAAAIPVGSAVMAKEDGPKLIPLVVTRPVMGRSAPGGADGGLFSSIRSG